MPYYYQLNQFKLHTLSITIVCSSFGEKQFSPLQEDKILDWFKLKQTAYDILKCV